MAVRKRRKLYSSSHLIGSSANPGRSLVCSLLKKLKADDLNYQIAKVADHFGMTKREVLTEILGRS